MKYKKLCFSSHWETGTPLVWAMGYGIGSIAQRATVEQLEWQEAEFNELRRLL